MYYCFNFSYGSKGHVEKQYEQFAEYYTTNLASHAITSVMHILSQHAANVYVSERVLYLSISHLAEALSHGQVWKTVKDHLMVSSVLQSINCVVLFVFRACSKQCCSR
jgi:hypothetical protein